VGEGNKLGRGSGTDSGVGDGERQRRRRRGRRDGTGRSKYHKSVAEVWWPVRMM
jgi:hypothetical protein